MFDGIRKDVQLDEARIVRRGPGPIGLMSNVKYNQGVSKSESDTGRFAFQKDHSIIWQKCRLASRRLVGTLFNNVGDKL